MKTAVCSALLLMLVSTVSEAVPDDNGSNRHSTVFPCVMVRYSTPIKVSGVFGVAIWRSIGNSKYFGPFFQLEPGFGGGKISAGMRYGECRFMPVFNAGIAVSLLHTWGDPLQGVEKDNTYIGLEGSVGLFVLGLNGGAFYHIAGDDDDSEWIYSLGIGVGI